MNAGFDVIRVALLHILQDGRMDLVAPLQGVAGAVEQLDLALPRPCAHDPDGMKSTVQPVEDTEVIEMIMRVVNDPLPWRNLNLSSHFAYPFCFSLTLPTTTP
jgi:hypothetical protein